VTTPDDLFREVVEALDLSLIIGPGVVKRALADIGADARSASPWQYKACIPHIGARLTSYVSPEEATARLAKVRVVVERAVLLAPPRPR
jgi:hypothetical protein